MDTTEKPTPTRDQMLTVLDSGRSLLMTKPDLLISCARMYATPEKGLGDTSWARRVMNYGDAERLFARMERDGLVVGKLAYEWRSAGVTDFLQTGGRYYVSARRALHIQQRLEKQEDAKLRQEAEEYARRALEKKHPEQFRELTDEAYNRMREQQ